MAETDVNDAAQRYAVIEQAYSKEDWAMVLRDGGELLQEIKQSGSPQFLGLRMRLQLLLGHTHLYGFADKRAAAEFYAAVASQSKEASLAKIAQQGLKQCNVSAPAAAEPQPETQTSPTPEATRGQPAAATATSPLTTSPKAASPFTGPAPATPDTPATAKAASPAAPWLTAMTPGSTPTPEATTTATPAPFMGEAGATPASETPLAEGKVKGGEPATPWSEESLIPEVVEEPELIELHQADPALAEELELTLTLQEPDPAQTSPAPVDAKEDEELLRGLLLVRVG